MQEINVEEIMKEIRKEVAEKGMKDEPLKFADVSLAENVMDIPEKFDADTTQKEILNMNALWDTIQSNEIRSTNGVKLAIKKVLNRAVMTIMRPVVIAQDIFNSSVVGTMNQLSCMIEENEQLKKEMEELKHEVELLKNAVNK